MPASRTPEGFPSRCPVCGAANEIEYSEVGKDAPCPNCGVLLIKSVQKIDLMRDRLAATLNADRSKLDEMSLNEIMGAFGADSLDVVELVMELEEEFDIDLPGGNL